MSFLRPTGDFRRGTVVSWRHSSEVLLGNALGDPVVRDHPVYLPPGYDNEINKRYPVLWSLAAYTNSGPGQVAWRNHGETLPERLDRLIGKGSIPPIIAVFPDCYTSLGGNQYVNSSAMGRYADYLVEELVPALDRAFRTIPKGSARAIIGKSSGGFGALHLCMRYPGVWASAASHAGDCGFDRVYTRDFPITCDVLARYKGDLTQFIQSFWKAKRPSHAEFHALMTVCLAASYSPDASRPLGLALPFDLVTCELEVDVWERWLSFDPALMTSSDAESLQELAALWIDVGQRDQYFMHYGCRSLAQKLESYKVQHVYEEFDGTHSGIDWRLDHSIPHLINAITHD